MSKIFALRATANREEQVIDFVATKAEANKLQVYSIFHPHDMRGYVFIEAETLQDAEQAAFGVNYSKGVIPVEVDFGEIEHMLSHVKKEYNIRQGDICELISGPFKREQAKITRVDPVKEEVVVELLESAVPIPVTVKMDAVKVIRRDSDE